MDFRRDEKLFVLDLYIFLSMKGRFIVTGTLENYF